MIEINYEIESDILRQYKYINQLVFIINEYKNKFRHFNINLTIKVTVNLPPHIGDQTINTMQEKDGIYTLIVPFRRHWISPRKLTPLPSPEDFDVSVRFALDSFFHSEFE